MTGFHTIGGQTIGNLGNTGNVTVQGTFTLPSAPPPLGGATAVKFGQATTSVQTVGSVQTVTNSVPVLTRDSWYWPGVNGESFAPTLGGSFATYNNILGRACYRIQGLTNGANTSITWPVIDRVSFDGTKTSRVDNFWLYRNITNANSCKVTGIWGTLDYGSSFTTYHLTGPAGGTVFDTTIPIGLNVWENVQLISDPVNGLKFSVGTSSVTLATVLVATNTSVATAWFVTGTLTAETYGFDNYSVTFQ